jgi:hypothetical protein
MSSTVSASLSVASCSELLRGDGSMLLSEAIDKNTKKKEADRDL